MHRRHLLILLICAGCPAPSPAFQEAPRSLFAFHATGRTKQGTPTQDLQGTAFVYDDAILLRITGGFAQLTPSYSERPNTWTAVLAFCHAEGPFVGRWDIRLRSKPLPVRQIKARADTLAEALEFVITGTRGLDLEAHWLAIQEHTYRYSVATGAWYEEQRPINGRPYMFDADLARRAQDGARCNERN